MKRLLLVISALSCVHSNAMLTNCWKGSGAMPFMRFVSQALPQAIETSHLKNKTMSSVEMNKKTKHSINEQINCFEESLSLSQTFLQTLSIVSKRPICNTYSFEDEEIKKLCKLVELKCKFKEYNAKITDIKQKIKTAESEVQEIVYKIKKANKKTPESVLFYALYLFDLEIEKNFLNTLVK